MCIDKRSQHYIEEYIKRGLYTFTLYTLYPDILYNNKTSPKMLHALSQI